MAKAIFNKGIENFSGSVGGMRYSKWKPGVSTVAAKVRPGKVRSVGQDAIRDRVKFVSQAWPWLSDEQQEQWLNIRVIARLAQRRNPETGGRRVILTSEEELSGHNAMVSLNQLAHSVGQTKILKTPRMDKPIPQPVYGLQAKIKLGHPPLWNDTKLIIKCDKVKNALKDQFVRFWIYSVPQRFHRQIGGIIPASQADKGVVITLIRSKGGEPVPIKSFTNTGVYVQADVVDKASGWASRPCRTIRVMIPVPNQHG